MKKPGVKLKKTNFKVMKKTGVKTKPVMKKPGMNNNPKTLGCMTCRGSVSGCWKCRDPAFGGKRITRSEWLKLGLK